MSNEQHREETHHVRIYRIAPTAVCENQMKLTQSRQTSKASNTHKSIATRLLRIMFLWSNGRATAEHSVLQAFFRHRTATTERQRRFCPHLSLATVRESWQCDPDRLRTAFSCRVSTNERSTGREPPRFSELWLATRLPLACHKHACRDRFRSPHQTYLLLDCR